MDNVTMGQFIRALRKRRGLTQRELAAQLHITDRAVSKWERGLCAPDLSLLEPLSRLLGCSVSELIAGRQSPEPAPEPVNEAARIAIAYSVAELQRKVKGVQRRTIQAAIICATILLLFALYALFQRGTFCTVDKIVSPDGTKTATVYSKALDGAHFSFKNATSLIVLLGEGAQLRITYGDCVYRGLWWAPDGSKYVLALEYPDRPYLALAWLERNAESNLSAYLAMGVEAAELGKDAAAPPDSHLDIDYQFLQWGRDSVSMLFYYSFRDEQQAQHDGYFWYNCETGNVHAVLELQP